MHVLIFKDSVDQPSVQLDVITATARGLKTFATVELTQGQKDEIELALRQALGER